MSFIQPILIPFNGSNFWVKFGAKIKIYEIVDLNTFFSIYYLECKCLIFY